MEIAPLRNLALGSAVPLGVCKACGSQQFAKRIRIVHPLMNLALVAKPSHLQGFPIILAQNQSSDLIAKHRSWVAEEVSPSPSRRRGSLFRWFLPYTQRIQENVGLYAQALMNKIPVGNRITPKILHELSARPPAY